MKKKLDLLVVVLLVIVALFLLAVGIIVAWETKSIAELFKFFSIASLIIMEAYIYYGLHVGGGEK